MKIPWLPKEYRGEPIKPVEADLRVREGRDEVLAGIDEEGKLFHVWGEDFAIGPRNTRYSLTTLLELESENVVAVTYPDYSGPKGMNFNAYLEHAKRVASGWSGTDDEGTVGNDFPKSLEWRRKTIQ